MRDECQNECQLLRNGASNHRGQIKQTTRVVIINESTRQSRNAIANFFFSLRTRT